MPGTAREPHTFILRNAAPKQNFRQEANAKKGMDVYHLVGALLLERRPEPGAESFSIFGKSWHRSVVKSSWLDTGQRLTHRPLRDEVLHPFLLREPDDRGQPARNLKKS